MTDRVGILIPTFNRPDLLRGSVLQWIAQSRPPDVICVHQNGNQESYEWCVSDLREICRIEWILTPQALNPVDWYRIPLQRLIALECNQFFWADHDDIYFRNHVQTRLAELDTHDYAISSRSGVLAVANNAFNLDRVVDFKNQPTGGHASSVAFNRAFAERLLAEFSKNPDVAYADTVMGDLIKSGDFRVCLSEKNTTIYKAHEGAVTSSSWFEQRLKQENKE